MTDQPVFSPPTIPPPPESAPCSVESCPKATPFGVPAPGWTQDTIGRAFCPTHPVDTACRICGRDKGGNRILCRGCATGEEPELYGSGEVSVPNNSGDGCHCGLGTWNDCATKPWGCANDQDHAGPDAASQSRTTPDNPVASGDTADNLLATPAELERRQRWAWSHAGLCPMCSHEDGKGRLCDACEADVRKMKAPDRRPWARFRQLSKGEPIQGSGYTPAELLGGDDGPTVATPRNDPDLRAQLAAILKVKDGKLPAWMGGGADTVGALVDELLAVVDDNLPDRAQAAIRALEQQVAVRDRQLAEARETNRRLNYRCQQVEHVGAVFKRAVNDWEWTDKGTYVPLRTLTAIAKAAGLTFDSGRLELHMQRVERLEAELAAVRALLAAPGNSRHILPGDLRAALDGAEAGQ
jgi:hypothetical protein